jgi:hypothetical protein
MLYRCEATFGPSYVCYHTYSRHNKPAVCKSAVKRMSLKWNHIAMNCFPPFIAGMDALKPGHILQTHSALQLAVEHKTKLADRWK